MTMPPSSFGIRHSAFVASGAFTILELLVVISIIITLAALILGTVGYVQKKGARSRAEAEIAALSAALESYKADNGAYPTDATATEQLDPASSPDVGKYQASTLYLYERLAGVTSGKRTETPTAKSYFVFKPNMLLPPPPSTADITAIRDPFGNSYGYSTMKASDSTKNGYNPTFDLWSTAGTGSTTSPPDQTQWVKNW